MMKAVLTVVSFNEDDSVDCYFEGEPTRRVSAEEFKEWLYDLILMNEVRHPQFFDRIVYEERVFMCYPKNY